MKHIITGNYWNRNSSIKWLHRTEKQSEEEAVPTPRLLAHNVKFDKAKVRTDGSGCSIYGDATDGVAEEVITGEFEAPPLKGRLRYRPGSGFTDEKNNVVKSVGTLLLEKDGGIFYSLDDLRQKPAKAAKPAKKTVLGGIKKLLTKKTTKKKK